MHITSKLQFKLCKQKFGEIVALARTKVTSPPRCRDPEHYRRVQAAARTYAQRDQADGEGQRHHEIARILDVISPSHTGHVSDRPLVLNGFEVELPAEIDVIVRPLPDPEQVM